MGLGGVLELGVSDRVRWVCWGLVGVLGLGGYDVIR